MSKLKRVSLLLFSVIAFLFTACEADFPMEEFDKELRKPKTRSEIACYSEPGEEPKFGCQLTGSDCREYISCGKVLQMSAKDYKGYYKENF